MGQISRITTWSSGQQPTAPALNGEFDNFLNTWNQTDTGVLAWGQVKSTNATSVPLIANATGTQTLANFKSSGTTVCSISNIGKISNQFGLCPGTSLTSSGGAWAGQGTPSYLGTSFLSGAKTLNANSLSVGTNIFIDVSGTYFSTNPGNLVYIFKIGSSSVTSPTFTLTTVSFKNFRLYVRFIATAVGQSATGVVFGRFIKDNGGSSDSTPTSESFVSTSMTTFDSTVNNTIDLVGQGNSTFTPAPYTGQIEIKN